MYIVCLFILGLLAEMQIVKYSQNNLENLRIFPTVNVILLNLYFLFSLWNNKSCTYVQRYILQKNCYIQSDLANFHLSSAILNWLGLTEILWNFSLKFSTTLLTYKRNLIPKNAVWNMLFRVGLEVRLPG
jgi:hypothetical protein